MSENRAGKRLGRPPNSDGKRTRGEILEAALGLFAAHGYGTTTVREIAEELGLSDSALYRYFPSKRALFDALLEESGPSVLSRLEISIGELINASPAEGLARLTRSLVTAWDTPTARKLTSLLIREGLSDLDRALSSVHGRLVPLFEQWNASRRLRPGLDPKALAWSFMAPLATVRLVYLNHQCSEADRTRGRALAEQHAALIAAAASAPSD